MKLEGQAAVVTGGGQGIGRAIVERLAAEGARVAVLDMNLNNAREVVNGLNTPSNHLALQIVLLLLPPSGRRVKLSVGSIWQSIMPALVRRRVMGLTNFMKQWASARKK